MKLLAQRTGASLYYREKGINEGIRVTLVIRSKPSITRQFDVLAA